MRKIKLNKDGINLFELTEVNTFEYLGVVNCKHATNFTIKNHPGFDYSDDDSLYFVRVRKVETGEIQHLFINEVE